MKMAPREGFEPPTRWLTVSSPVFLPCFLKIDESLKNQHFKHIPEIPSLIVYFVF